MRDTATTEATSGRRIQWIDVARGIGIILVVLGHVERGLVSAHIAVASFWQTVDFGIYTFHMPLFFFLAGLNVPRALRKGSANFIRGKLWTIGYPYLLWSIVQGGILIAMSSLTNAPAHVSDLLRIGWRPMSQFWFLYVLMICQFAALLLSNVRYAMAGVAIAALSVSFACARNHLPNQILHSFPFFAAGILLSGRALSKTPRWDAVLAFSALIVWLLSFYASREAGSDFMSLAALPAAVSGVACVVWLSRAWGQGSSYLALLGTASMTIYVLHILAAAGTRIVLRKMGLTMPWIYLSACMITGVGGPLAVHILLDKHSLLGWVGLANPGSRKSQRDDQHDQRRAANASASAS